MKTRFVLCGICSSILFSAALTSGAQEAEQTVPNKNNDSAKPAPPVTSNSSLTEKLKAAAANLSPPVMEIVRMSDAGADPAVIQAFVENSPTTYSPRSEEIIYLHDHGISAPIITAIIQHRGTVRAQADAAAAAAPAANGYTTVQPAAPSYVAPTTYVYPDYASYPNYVYNYPGYSYSSLWYPSFGLYFSAPFFYGHSHYGHSFGGGFHFAHSSGAFHSGVRTFGHH